jgi:hypothetical protein
VTCDEDGTVSGRPASSLDLPRSFDDSSRRDILEAQVAMRRLIALVRRNFGYAEIDFVFRPDDAK